MKRTSADANRPVIDGQAFPANQQATHIANTAQPNGGNAAVHALVRTIPPTMVPGIAPSPAVLPPFQLARPPQFILGGPGMASSIPMSVAPPPVVNGGMPLPEMAVPPPSAPDAVAQLKSIFEDKALMARVQAAVGKGRNAWYAAFLALQGEEQIRFGIASIDHIGQKWGPSFNVWRGALNACCRRVGMERLLAQEWGGRTPYVSVLAVLGLNELLAEALKTGAGKASLRKASKHGDTPLHLAARYCNFKAAQLILSADDAEGTLRVKGNGCGGLPIHFAALYGADDIAGLLLARKGKEQRLTASNNGRLPICYAISVAANAALVSTLLEECAEEQVVARYEPSKMTVLMVAIRVGSPDIVRLLLDVRSALPQQLTMRDDRNRTALDYAKQADNPEILALIEAAMKDLPEASSSNSTSTGATMSNSATTTTASGPAPGTGDGPVPLTPYPATPMADAWPEIEEEFEAPDL
jgi:ankyrin repeat protein